MAIDLYDGRLNCFSVHNQYFIRPTLRQEHARERQHDAQNYEVSKIAAPIHDGPPLILLCLGQGMRLGYSDLALTTSDAFRPDTIRVWSGQRHLIFTFEPTLMGVFTRMHAPEGDLSSNLASASCEVPFWSSHDTSAIAKRAVLSSALFPLMLGMIGKKSKGLTSYLSAVIDLTTTKTLFAIDHHELAIFKAAQARANVITASV
jgi:hypothetical protein